MTAELDEFNRAAQGFYIVPPQQKRSSGSKKHKRQKVAGNGPFVPLFEQESDFMISKRKEGLEQTLREVEAVLDRVRNDLNAKTMEDVCGFLLNSVAYANVLDSSQQIPVAMISSESCPDDHDSMMATLFHSIQSVSLPNAKFIRIDAEVDGQNFQSFTRALMGETSRRRVDFDDDFLMKLDEDGSQVVVVIDNSEQLLQSVLLSFLSRFRSQSLHRLALILGSSSSTCALFQSVLNDQITKMMQISVFRDLDASLALKEFLKYMIFDLNVKVSPGSGVLHVLVENFQTRNGSLKSMFHMLKFALMDHFFSNPLSCIPFLEPKEMKLLTREHIEQARSCYSFRSYIDRKKEDDPEKCIRLIKDDAFFLGRLEDQIVYQPIFREELRSVYEILAEVNDALKAKSFSKIDPLKLLVSVTSTEFALDSKFDGLMKAIKFMSLEQFQAFSAALGVRLQKVKSDLKAPNDDFIKLSDHFKRKSKLPAGELRVISQNLLYTYLTKYHQPYQQFPFHEIQFIANAGKLAKASNAQPRAAIQSALSYPGHYYGCDNAPGDFANFDDVSVAYYVYLESGNLVNLFDWFTSFSSIINNDNNRKPTDAKMTLARFVRSVTELHYCGFLKPTNRKTDHVMRLTFGY